MVTKVGFVDFAAKYLFIVNKDGGIVPLRLTDNQMKVAAALSSPRVLILKARQLGITTVVQARVFTDLITRRNYKSLTLAHDQNTTDAIRRIQRNFLKFFPSPKPQASYDNAKTVQFGDTNSVGSVATAGNTTVGRGHTLNIVHGSEVSFWSDPADTLAGLTQSGNPKVILESTPNGARGWFYEEWNNPTSPYQKLFFPWWSNPEYTTVVEEGFELTEEERHLGLSDGQAAWRRQKQNELKHLFIQEYPEDPHTCFLSSVSGYISNIRQCLWSGDENYTGEAYAGLDFGQVNDPTVLSIFDNEGRQIALYSWVKLPWLAIRERIIEKVKQHSVTYLLAEANSIGAPNIEALRDAGCPIVAFTTTAQSKRDIIDKLSSAVQSGKVKLLDDREQIHQFDVFTAVQSANGNWQLRAPHGAHDDIVIATALGYEAWQRGRRDGSRNMMESINAIRR